MPRADQHRRRAEHVAGLRATWPARSWRSNFGASAASIWAQGSRVASTASGSRRLIIASMRARKKSGVSILESPRNQVQLN